MEISWNFVSPEKWEPCNYVGLIFKDGSLNGLNVVSGSQIKYNCGSRIAQMGPPTPKAWVLTYYLARFLERMHENERDWTKRECASLAPPLIRY